MRRSHICVLAVLAFAGTALADPTPGTIMKVTPPADADADRICHLHVEMDMAQIGHLKAALKLDAAQETVFEAWRKVHAEAVHSLPCQPLATGLNIPIPERMRNQITAMAAELAALRKEEPATDALYQALRPEQRAIFDGPKQVTPPPKAPPPPAKP
jgi:hypothetical protein